MTKRILVDAVHPEEIRVAVADDAKLVEFDFESTEKKQLKSNIYLGKITRVEPSLQAAFVEYGGNRQGFLPFSEIHYDYYQIPVEDKEKLQKTLAAERKREEQRIAEMEARESARAAAEENNIEGNVSENMIDGNADEPAPIETLSPDDNAYPEQQERRADRGDRGDRRGRYGRSDRGDRGDRGGRRGGRDRDRGNRGHRSDRGRSFRRPYIEIQPPFTQSDLQDLIRAEEVARSFGIELFGEEEYNEKYSGKPKEEAQPVNETENQITANAEDQVQENETANITAPVEENREVSADISEDNSNISEVEIDEDNSVPEITEEGGDRQLSRMEFYKQYKIQEVIKRNQIVLIQIVKEERGSKGASLTTYLALAGRYCVFMPNTDKGGGVSRRISNFSERRRIRDAIKQLNTPIGTSVIIRTAGMERDVEDIKKDYNYLLSLWDNIRKQTMASSAPALIYEESDIVKRSLRDMLKSDVSEVYIEGRETYDSARKFMELVGPNQVPMLKEYNGKAPIFQKFKIEEKLDELYDPEVKLESGGSIVITPTEALVSIDVNSGKATKERSVEDTALKTNIEAAREIARHLKLRDLAGLIVIDFIDMRELRNKKAVERELKDALKADKAKIQLGRISAFGLLEMSRQRLRSSLVESSSSKCPMCRGIGVVRTNESLVLKAIRAIEAEAGKKTVKEIFLRAAPAIAHSINEHRLDEVRQIEKEADVRIVIESDTSLLPNQFEISTHKFARKEKQEQEKVETQNKRPQQEKLSGEAAIPSESEIDADVDEQLDAWKKEVADVERMESRRYDRNDRGDRGERSENGGNGERRNNNNRNGERRNNNNRNRGPRAENDGNGNGNGGERRNNNNRGGRNNNNRNRGRNGGRNNNRYNNNYNGDNFGNQQQEENNYGNYAAEENNVQRIDSYQEKREQNAPASQNSNEGDKQAPSKLVGLWKKITS